MIIVLTMTSFPSAICRSSAKSSYPTGWRCTPAPTDKSSLQDVCVSLHIPLYPLCCPQPSAMMSLHLSWQVTVLWQHRAQQGSFNLPTICQAPKPALSRHLLHTDHSDTSRLCQETASEITIYDLQHGLEPTGRSRQLLLDKEDNVNLGRPHANNYI